MARSQASSARRILVGNRVRLGFAEPALGGVRIETARELRDSLQHSGQVSAEAVEAVTGGAIAFAETADQRGHPGLHRRARALAQHSTRARVTRAPSCDTGADGEDAMRVTAEPEPLRAARAFASEIRAGAAGAEAAARRDARPRPT